MFEKLIVKLAVMCWSAFIAVLVWVLITIGQAEVAVSITMLWFTSVYIVNVLEDKQFNKRD